ncbi:MAG TPA: UDP-N-acetylmuramoyl-L-alanyl-D-glutamate--2,6-diaminopimelate ligase [Rubrivivax sp.]|nr:UDP-N-acetylmuramoyl-L-alanyl-D-glutamate--2,6-diaminopimelate ligase [Burkholderiales bacterium]HNU10227.1 UDP-N-acetylmuramoyl-L-alanyl-D-glutamate--2,6-diaminopimelate ligase [Rubrivivax sp.]
MALLRLDSPSAALHFIAGHGCTGLCADSRRLRAGDAFLAWPGHGGDGRRHVQQALAAGAAACLVEAEGVRAYAWTDARIAALAGLKAAAGPIASAFHGDPSARLDVLAFTGTNGKTSSAWFAAHALALLGRRAGIVGTLGIGEAGTVLADAGLTTPDALGLQAALAGFVASGLRACAIEASSIGLAEQRLAGTRIAVAAFTNFTRDHLDYHGDMDAYWTAKRMLFDWPGLRAAVINVDDPQGALLADELQGRARALGLALWTVSLHRPARLSARGLRHTDAGLAFEIDEQATVAAGNPTGGTRADKGTDAQAVDDRSAEVASPLVGDYNASNLLVVTAALRALGLPLRQIAAVLPRLPAVPGRLQRVAGGAAAEPAVLVDYAHTPDALEQVLQALRPLADARGGRLWCVFGCGGNRDASKRPLMGAIAERLADEVVLTSDNPRNEVPAEILAQILAGMHGVGAHRAPAVIVDRAEAIADAIARAAAADVVLLAGKGHETTQEIAGIRRPFDDAQVALAALQRRCGEAAR